MFRKRNQVTFAQYFRVGIGVKMVEQKAGLSRELGSDLLP